jgi:starch synthase
MEIIHIASELAPLAKVGGLADVLFGLCKALSEEGENIELFLPKYDCLALDQIEDLKLIHRDFSSYFDGHWHQNHIWQGKVNGFSSLFFEPKDPWGFFKRETIYGCMDDSDRFLYFNRLVLDYLHQSRRKVDILHVHDWHTSIIPLLQKEIYLNALSPKIILSIHNLAYQGLTSSETLKKVGLPDSFLQKKDPKEMWNLLAEGIVYADFVTTVSPTYVKEILTEMGGKGLHDLLLKHQYKLRGILNGIDETFWSPSTDKSLPYHYSKADIEGLHPPFIENKWKIQKHVRQMFSINGSNPKLPLTGCVTRLVPQKNPKLIKSALSWTLKQGGAFILLGATHELQTREEFSDLKKSLGSTSVHIELNYNEPLAHLIFAALDLFVIPSLFEPCGLTQMIAMRYGTLPLVRKTGGLADTVFDGVNGFTFEEATVEELHENLKRAFHVWSSEPQKWRQMMEKGMSMDFSWQKPAREYLKLYYSLIHDRAGLKYSL